MAPNRKLLSLLLLAFTLISTCVYGQEYLHPDDDPALPRVSYEQYVSDGGLLFTDVPGLSVSGEEVSLEALLDRGTTQEVYFENWYIRQIELKASDCGWKAILGRTPDPDLSRSDIVKKFLVDAVDTLTNQRIQVVATMIPSEEYCKKYGSESLSYLYKPDFDGITIYGRYDGTFEDVYVYSMGLIETGEIIDGKEAPLRSKVRFLTLVKDGNDSSEEPRTICIAKK